MSLRKRLKIKKKDWPTVVKAAAEVGLGPDEWIATVVVNRAKYSVENPGKQPGIGGVKFNPRN